jgi:AraC family ethanolamine operon transcriptional activator
MTTGTNHIKKRTASFEGRILSRVFDDHEEFASALCGWIPRMRKLDRGPFAGSLLQIDLGEVRVVHARVDSLLEIEGIAPLGYRTFGIPCGQRSVGHWCGRSISGGRFVNSFDASGSFEAVMRPGFETFVVSVREDWLSSRRESLEIPTEAGCGGSRVSEYDPTSLRSLARILRTGTRSALSDSTAGGRVALRELLCVDLPGRLLGLSIEEKQGSGLSPRLRDRILRQARDWIESSPADGLTVANLCRDIGAGERTLRRAFLEYYGVSPRDYLKAQRLNRVYRELVESAPGHGRVSKIANQWGFWHMGQLAADYRHLFNELPSDTLARVR